MDIKFKDEAPEQFRNIEATSFGTSRDSLMISFHGFEDRLEMTEFCDYLFSKIKMNYHSLDKPQTIH